MIKRIIITTLLLGSVCLFEPTTHSRNSNPTKKPNSINTVALPISGNRWHYEVTAIAEGKELLVEAMLPPGISEKLRVFPNAEDYLKNLEIALNNDTWQPIVQKGGFWFLPKSATNRGCRIRYRYLLAESAKANNDLEIAKLGNEIIYAPPSTWLIHPAYKNFNYQATFHVKTPAGISFVSGAFPTENKDTYQVPSSEIHQLTYSAFGKMRLHTIKLAGGKIDLAIAPGSNSIDDEQVISWVKKAGQSIATYYDGFPVNRALVIARVHRGRGIGGGSAIGNAGASVNIAVGTNTRQSDFDTDWIITHELAHIGFPSVPRTKHAWLEEGTATYIEPVARVRTGEHSREEFWKEMVENMYQGLPEYGDKGLDNTPTWGRTYWGGALFCLLADVEIRQKTKNRYGLEHAFRGIVSSGGTINNDWDVITTLTEGDKAIGVSVLVPLYNKMKATPVKVDLQDLWKRLGVENYNGEITFNDDAPLAHIRDAITSSK
ncbi:MAG: hypothetical protein JNM06_23435 [Blastocatellia bacterium]|nr:hypothetical protein [Blastocatellia bacterium]MBN8725927.1 hypothetical protein [Acidobacteriota bacterium]